MASLNAHLINRIVVLLLAVSALYFTFDEHYHKIKTSLLSLLIIIFLVFAVATSFGITVHTIWRYVKHDKKT